MTITNTTQPQATTLRRAGDISALDAISMLGEQEGAVLVAVGTNADEFAKRLAANIPNRSQLILVIDEDGSTSQAAADAAAAAGYRRVLNVADGYRGLGDACPSLIPDGLELTEAARP